MLRHPSAKNPALNENQPFVDDQMSDSNDNHNDNANNSVLDDIYDTDFDIHNYSKKIACTKRRLSKIHEGPKSIQFLEKLKLMGLSDGRICYYADRIALLLEEFEKLGIKLKNAKKSHCESVLSKIISKKTTRARQSLLMH